MERAFPSPELEGREVGEVRTGPHLHPPSLSSGSDPYWRAKELSLMDKTIYPLPVEPYLTYPSGSTLHQARQGGTGAV